MKFDPKTFNTSAVFYALAEIHPMLDDPDGKMYWRWCQLQLTIHKPWIRTPLKLWGDEYSSLADIPKHVFEEKWEEFVNTTERDREVQNRFDRHRTERAACNDALFDLDKYAEQGWTGTQDYSFGNTVGDMTGNGCTRAEEILRTGRDWKAERAARDTTRDKYTDDEVDMAMSWLRKQKKEQQELTMRDFGVVDSSKMNDEQKLMWVILQLACRDELEINGEKRQVLMQMRGKPGTGKSFVLQCAQTDDIFQKHARLTAMTGSAGCLIGGTTLHSLVLLPVRDARRGPLDGPDKTNVEQRPRHFACYCSCDMYRSSHICMTLPHHANMYYFHHDIIQNLYHTTLMPNSGATSHCTVSNEMPRMANVRVIIIDEKSMLSQEQLGWLDMRLKAAQPDEAKKALDFGGYHVFFFGDFQQIQPVGGNVMYDKKDIDAKQKSANMIEKGRTLYTKITDVLELTHNYRINNAEDDLTRRFIKEMHKIGDGECSAADWPFWQQFMDHIKPEKTQAFADDPATTFLVPTNPQAATMNSDFVNSTTQESPLFQWPATNTGRARGAKLNEVNMLRSYIGVRPGSTQ